jgi:NAD(P)-dependent dehydrogenase (short-subunit alcohol dehydrogenase family)
MESFAGKMAVITGGGSGMGRELVIQLAASGCSVATCDLNPNHISETVDLVAGILRERMLSTEKREGEGVRVSGHLCDVSEEEQVLRFRDEVVDQHGLDHVDLVFNNAGIGGGGSIIRDRREVWERTFAVDWWGVYYCTLAFLPLLLKSEDAMLVNTSSVNGFWATLGPGMPHTAYSTAKFAVKGFTEALIEDFRVNAPHVKVAVVMPGHVGTDIVFNSQRAHGLPEPEAMTEKDLEEWRPSVGMGGDAGTKATVEELRTLMRQVGEGFKQLAPLSAAAAATEILDGVRAGKWRILVGRDAEALDARVRSDPEDAYDFAKTNLWG